MKDPISEWPRIKKELRTRPVLLLLNYEGILVPAPPSGSHLDHNLRELLISLRSKPSLTVAIMSRMKLSNLQNLIRINGMYYSGNHGLEIRGPEIEFVHPICTTQDSSELQPLKTALQEQTNELSGISVDDNGVSLYLYYPTLDNGQRELVREKINAAVQSYSSTGKFRSVEGKDSTEILPVINWDKGRVIKMFENLISSRKSQPLTIYLGADPATDEDAFRAIRGKGIGILVGRKSATTAGYYLAGHSEVVDFLLLLESFY
ncbi:MAG: trehalose-phosphatase [bacterium]